MSARAGCLPRLALVGISGYGRAYLDWVEEALDQCRVNLVAAVVINRDQEQEACARLEAQGAVIYRDWREMLEAWKGRLDLCLAPVPIHLHSEFAVAAMEAGANVLVEKPLAATEAQARRIQAAERRTGRWVAVGYQDFYTAATRSISDDIASGRIGRVHSVRWLGLWPRPLSYYQRNSWAGRISISGQPVRDSPLNNAMAHYLNLALHWAWAGSGRKPEPVFTEAELYRSHAIESFDTAVLRLRTSADVTIHAAVSHCCPADRPIELRILGEEGELRWTHRERAIWFAGRVKDEEVCLGGRDTAISSMFDAALARLENPEARVCTTEQALLQVSAIESLPTEIRTIEPSFRTRQARNGDTFLLVENIERDLAACMEREALPTEIGAAWAPGAGLAVA